MSNRCLLIGFIFVLIVLSYYIPNLWMLTTIIIAIVLIEIYFKDKTVDILR